MIALFFFISICTAIKTADNEIFPHDDVADNVKHGCELMIRDIKEDGDECTKAAFDGRVCKIEMDTDCVAARQGQRRCDALFETRDQSYGAPCYSAYTFIPRLNKCRASVCTEGRFHKATKWMESLLRGFYKN